MRKMTLSLIAGAAALATAGTAYGQQAQTSRPPMTRTAAEQRAAQTFDRLDANHDGKLDQADRAAREKARFDRLDSNHDGALSYAEFTAPQDRHGGARKERLAERSQQGGEGFARHGGHRMGGFHGRGGLGMTRFADADKDGTVTKAEFQSAALTRFDRLDANHDGTVTPDEAKAARDNMRQQWQSRREARTS